jgi:hypothetical protein
VACGIYVTAVPDLLLCSGVQQGPVCQGGGGKFFKMDFCLCGAILNLKAFCFGAIPDIMIKLSLCECATKQAVK